MTNLDRKVLDEIARRGLKPRPYAYFLARRSVFWALAILSILLGAIATALAVFAVQDKIHTGGRGLDEMPLDDVLTYLPLVWLIILALFVASAVLSLRHTRRGYRLRSWQVILIALLASLGLGVVLHLGHAGEHVHRWLAHAVPAYDQLTRSRETRRNAPDQGFLAGQIVSAGDDKRLAIRDFDGRLWSVDATSARIEIGHMRPGEDAAVEGRRTGPTEFKADLVRDWD